MRMKEDLRRARKEKETKRVLPLLRLSLINGRFQIGFAYQVFAVL
jgi:hypothetical protein